MVVVCYSLIGCDGRDHFSLAATVIAFTFLFALYNYDIVIVSVVSFQVESLQFAHTRIK